MPNGLLPSLPSTFPSRKVTERTTLAVWNWAFQLEQTLQPTKVIPRLEEHSPPCPPTVFVTWHVHM